MIDIFSDLAATLFGTVIDVAPIAGVLLFFQVVVLRVRIPNLRRTLVGFFYVILGLTLFLVGLNEALFPLGKIMADQLTRAPLASGDTINVASFVWVYVFAASLGFATTIAEPSLMAVALKARQASGGGISVWGLRIAVAIGVGIGVGLGAYRIVSGYPLIYFIVFAYAIVIFQTFHAPRTIIPLAYDSGGVTTSTVTVPLVAALGLGLAESIPGRSPIIDGFGLIAFASVFPIIAVLGYAQMGSWRAERRSKRRTEI